MGVSTNGQLCYGVMFEEGFEFPWDEYDDIDEWWKEVKCFTPIAINPFNIEGNYAEGFNGKSPEVKAYFDEQSDWEKSNPMPIKLVNYCSGDCPMYIVTTPSASFYSRRGDAVGIDGSELLKEQEESHNTIVQFLEEYDIEYENEPCWLLSSCWN